MALAGLMLLVACDQPSTVSVAIGEPATKPPEPGIAATMVSAPAKRVLADGEAWLVDDGVSPLGTAVRKPGLAMVVHFVDDSRPILYNRLHRLTYHGHTAKFGEAFPVDAYDLEELGLEAPAEAVWTFGPLGPCSATVGQPYVGRPSVSVRVFEVSYALETCGGEGRWAPFASTSPLMPKGVLWRDARVSDDAAYDRGEAWQHPIAPLVEPPDSPTAEAFVAHARWVDLQPQPAQALVTAVEPSSQGECGAETHHATLGWWREDAFESIEAPWLDAADPPLLVGAIGWGSDPAALVFDDGLDGMLAVPPAEDEASGPPQWVVRPLVAGRWSEADRRAAALRIQACR